MNAIIHINGMPGVGKLTVAKVLARDLSAKLIDNHLAIDLVLSVCERGSSQYFKMLAEIMAVMHKSLADRPKDEIFIFTNALAQGLPEDEERFQSIENLAVKLGKAFVPILITCDMDENMTRLTNVERKQKRKLTDRDNLQKIIETYRLVHDDNQLNSLKIDTTNLTPEQAATKICAHIQERIT